MQSWAQEELKCAQLPDARLNRRLMKLVEDFANQPTASIPQASGNKAATKGAYRFFNSPRVKPEDIRMAHIQNSIQRLNQEKQAMVLIIQDTTELDFSDHPATKNIGYLDHPAKRGLKVHSTLTVNLEGVPLGMVYQEVWARDPKSLGKRHNRRKFQTKDKESQRWLNGLIASQQRIPEGIQVVCIADREADIYDLFALPRRGGVELLIRAAHNRLVDHEAGHLWEAIRQSPIRGEITIKLGRKAQQPPRKATLTVRYEKLAILPPKHRANRSSLKPILVNVILVEEEAPPKGVSAVRWLMITTLPVNSFEDAIRCTKWYSFRWLIERYHFVLKSGCAIEELQLEEADGIHRALATYCIVAWRLLWLTHEARENPDMPCDKVLEVHEWQSLYCKVHETLKLPKKVPSLREAVRWIAQLGGFLGRKGDGEPGVKTIWRGLMRLHDIADTWKLLHSATHNIHNVHNLSSNYG